MIPYVLLHRPPLRGVLALLLLGSAVALCGCARGESAQERHWAQMRESIQKIQTDNERLSERLSALEIATDERRRQGKPPAPVPENRQADQRVIHLSPGDHVGGDPALNGEDPDDSTPRPSIKVTGNPGRARGKTAPPGSATLSVVDARTPDDDAPPVRGPAIRSGDTPKPSALDPEARKAYEAALATVHEKQYSKALERLAAFLVKYPDHPNAENALYWRGECYYALGDYPRALEQFQGVVARPMGNKTPDALLKIGITEQKLGHPDKARASFDKLSREYPKSEAARRIQSTVGKETP